MKFLKSAIPLLLVTLQPLLKDRLKADHELGIRGERRSRVCHKVRLLREAGDREPVLVIVNRRGNSRNDGKHADWAVADLLKKTIQE